MRTDDEIYEILGALTRSAVRESIDTSLHENSAAIDDADKKTPSIQPHAFEISDLEATDIDPEIDAFIARQTAADIFKARPADDEKFYIIVEDDKDDPEKTDFSEEKAGTIASALSELGAFVAKVPPEDFAPFFLKEKEKYW